MIGSSALQLVDRTDLVESMSLTVGVEDLSQRPLSAAWEEILSHESGSVPSSKDQLLVQVFLSFCMKTKTKMTQPQLHVYDVLQRHRFEQVTGLAW